MASLRDAVAEILTDDGALMAILTGGIYSTPIDRNATPGAFDDQTGRLKPCAVLTMETATPSGFMGEQAFFSIYLYQYGGYNAIDDAIRRIKTTLDRRANEDLGDEGLVYEFRHTEDSGDLLATELNNAPMRYSRYSAVRQK